MKLAHRFHLVLATMALTLLGGCASTGTRQGVGEYLSDAYITSRVKASFAIDPQVNAADVRVETYKGTVQLSGFVESPASGQRAGELARHVGGVKQVRNDTMLRSGQTAAKPADTAPKPADTAPKPDDAAPKPEQPVSGVGSGQ